MGKNFRDEEYYTYSHPRDTQIKKEYVYIKDSYKFPQNMDDIQHNKPYSGVSSNLRAYRKYNEPYFIRIKDSSHIFLLPANLSDDGFRKLRDYITPRSI